jgi:hypothetical protein
MIRTLHIIAIAVSVLALSNTAHAQLAPQNPSDLVTLKISNMGEHCSGNQGFKMNRRVFSDGSTDTFSIPDGQVLVITDFQWGPTFVGANNFESVALTIETVFYGQTAVGVGGNNSPGAAGGANGLAGSGASIQNLVAVKPGVSICVNGGIQPNPFAIVHGFLAIDQ